MFSLRSNINKDKSLPESELIKLIAKKSGYSQAKVKDILYATKEVILESLAAGFTVKLHKVATLYVADPFTYTTRSVRDLEKTVEVNIPSKIKVCISDVLQRAFQEIKSNQN